jgi:ferredoxin--NADP+ reductase
MVITAIGYRGRPIPGLPFDDVAGVIPSVAGRVVHDGKTVPRVYVVGWIKHGPKGVIAASKVDAAQTVSAVLADLTQPDDRCPGTITGPGRLQRPPFVAPVSATDWAGWLRLDAYELATGRARGAPRVKCQELAAMLAYCRADATT